MRHPLQYKPGQRPLFCLAFLLFFNAALPAQALRNVPYYSAGTAEVRDKLAEETAASVRAKFQEPEQFNKEAKKAYQDQRERMALNVSEEIRQSAIPDDALWPFIKMTHAAIVAANPESAGTKIILEIDPTPNAFSIGEGTIIVYSGLLAGLENEDQLAFVLCHEIAHFLLEHATKGLVRQVKTFHSKEFKDKVKAVNAQEYNRSEHIENMFKNVLFNSRYHHRDLERQADSLAYILFLKTPYAPAQAQRLMQLFEYMDEPLRDSVLRLENHFGCAGYTFQAHWLEKSHGSVWTGAKTLSDAAEKPMQDSMRTHPDWKNRMQWIEEMSKTTPAGITTTAGVDNSYAPIKFMSIVESVEAWFNMERYDQALYFAVQYQNVYPDCSYFKEIQALSLYGLYAHSKDHTLATVLAESSPDYPDKYNRFLDFLNNLRLKDLLALQNCSAKALEEGKTEYGLLAAYYIALAQEDNGNMNSVRREYLANYRKGRFAEFFRNTKK